MPNWSERFMTGKDYVEFDWFDRSDEKEFINMAKGMRLISEFQLFIGWKWLITICIEEM